MSNNYTPTSFQIRNIKNGERLWWEKRYAELEAKAEIDYDSFPNVNYTFGEHLHIWSVDSCNIEALAELIHEFVVKHRPAEYVSFTWAYTTDGLDIDGFSGSGVFITADQIKWFSPYIDIISAQDAFDEALLDKETKDHGVL